LQKGGKGVAASGRTRGKKPKGLALEEIKRGFLTKKTAAVGLFSPVIGTGRTLRIVRDAVGGGSAAARHREENMDRPSDTRLLRYG